MADLDQLKQKYQPVLNTIAKEGAELNNLSLDGNQLALKATAVSEASKNRIWDSIKAVDPTYSDLKHDIEVRPGQQVYTVQAETISPKSASIFTAMPTNIWPSPKPTISTIQTRSRLDRSLRDSRLTLTARRCNQARRRPRKGDRVMGLLIDSTMYCNNTKVEQAQPEPPANVQLHFDQGCAGRSTG